MEIILHCVGRLDREWTVLFDEYAARIRHFSQLKVLEVAEPKGRFKNPAEAVQRYSAELAAQIGREPYFIFDRTGPELTSPEFSDWLGGRLEVPPQRVRLAIGGSDGLDERIVAGAAGRISFSRLTFPHQLFRVLLVEQIYRAFTIRRGIPYHK